MDQAALRLRTREQAARDGAALLVQGGRLTNASLAMIERSRKTITESGAQLVMSRLRLKQSHRQLLKGRPAT
jgi:hypothetical protein